MDFKNISDITWIEWVNFIGVTITCVAWIILILHFKKRCEAEDKRLEDARKKHNEWYQKRHGKDAPTRKSWM